MKRAWAALAMMCAVIGCTGAQGEPGPAGPKGEQGAMGPQGAPGAGLMQCPAGQVLQSTGTGWACASPSGAGVPVGTMLPYAGAVIPNGWLPCDGREVPTSQYPELCTILGTTYGTPNALNHCTLPDARGRVLVGAGQGAAPVNRDAGVSYGAENVTLSVAQMPSHGHELYLYEAGSTGTPGTYFTLNWFAVPGFGNNSQMSPAQLSGGAQTFMRVLAAGGGMPFNNAQPSLVVSCIVKY